MEMIAKREWSTSIGSYDEDVLVAALEMAKQTYSWMPSIAEFLQLIEIPSWSTAINRLHAMLLDFEASS